jgi:hypothetical protein
MMYFAFIISPHQIKVMDVYHFILLSELEEDYQVMNGKSN